jgi:LAO/AO transport system kinase
MANSWGDLVDGVKGGDLRSLARMITRVENRASGWKAAMKAIYPAAGRARVFGITGSPGAGKSTLTNKVALGLVEKGFRVGIIAVDPSSPFSGGALLGDRLRMGDIATKEGIFIRSMATRGALGGLCQGARDVSRILDAYGMDIVLIETVGVGQDEIEVVKAADLVMVICVPGQGDGIQALKAGIMEIADVFVVNKADREGADEVVADISMMLELSSEADGKKPPVMKTSALNGDGIECLVDTILEMSEGKQRPEAQEEERIREEILLLLEREVALYVRNVWANNGSLQAAVEQVLQGKSDPYTIAEEMISVIRDRSSGETRGKA